MTLRPKLLIVLSLSGILAGCIGSPMRQAAPGTAPPAPQADKAVVVFMRTDWGGIQSSVFDVTQPANQTDKLVGIVSAGTRVAYVADPGDHLFMVIGENADFMTATLAPGKTYYALVAPRMGWWKTRFSLEPIHQAQLASSDFRQELGATQLVENTPESEAWAKENWASIQDKKVDYLRTWNGKPQSDRDEQRLLVTDGV